MIQQIPNIITISRILCVPILACIIIFAPAYHYLALVIFILAAASDFLDGYLARKLNAMSEFGKMLDPIADKLLVGVLLLAIAAANNLTYIGLVSAIAILFREIFVSGLREYFAGQLSLAVTFLAKVKTSVQLIAIGFLLAQPIDRIFIIIGNWALVIAAILTIYTGVQYFKASIDFIRSKEQKS